VNSLQTNNTIEGSPSNTAENWRQVIEKYQTPAVRRGVWQILNTLVPYLALWGVIRLLLPISFWLTIPVAILAGGFLVRLFIIFHDSGQEGE
jgi:omega-6 fatty acid desaturase (delta-12 desaturase)